MNLSDFDYHLPEELIAQTPYQKRDNARLLIYNKQEKNIQHQYFYNLIDHLKEGDVLFFNNSKVIKSRLFANKLSGAKIEVFLLKNINKDDNTWHCLLRGRIKIGERLVFNQDVSLVVLDKKDDYYICSFDCDYRETVDYIDEYGSMPLPPYIKQDKDNISLDAYQTVYAKDDKSGSVAAPTAGLHFSNGLIEDIKKKGIEVLEASLHVGLGTFSSIKVEKIEDHKIHSEDIEVSKEVIISLIKAKNENRRIVAVGTTSCRILESLHSFLQYDNKSGKYSLDNIQDMSFATDIFIYPSYQFKLVDALITNFHLPKSSLLLLVSALMTRDETLRVYQEAINKSYRFFSYGDAMLII